ncbi:MAG: DUF3095 family protein [Gemmatimonadetes bacterium]|nr:DUF3095 family protein [Gemmatimonadota bacterium]NNM34763.1 DUF3095 family protein [Gemmatimonadota bacterium]
MDARPTFYSDLPVRGDSLVELLGDGDHFAHVPGDWHVVVTDIVNSTQSIDGGRHELVNLVAAGSIIAVLNLARARGLRVPFFFGGDGATLIVPKSLLEPGLTALRAHSGRSRNAFDLSLRVGSVAAEDLYAGGHRIGIARHQASERLDVPVVLGDGLIESERRVKSEAGGDAIEHAAQDELDLSGMECRWDRIEPPEKSHEVVCLLLSAIDDRTQAVVFRQVIELIDSIYGAAEARNPVSALRLKLSGRKVAAETRSRLGRLDPGTFLNTWLSVQLGKLMWSPTRAGRAYKREVAELTDTLVIDGRISTVIAGTEAQRRRLSQRLEAMEDENLIAFGLFVTRQSVMSCYVQDRQGRHIHFVDGADGGYTMAAKVLKRKLRMGF